MLESIDLDQAVTSPFYCTRLDPPLMLPLDDGVCFKPHSYFLLITLSLYSLFKPPFFLTGARSLNR